MRQVKRRPIKLMSSGYRYAGLNVLEMMNLRSLKKTIAMYIALARNSEGTTRSERYYIVLSRLLVLYRRFTLYEIDTQPKRRVLHFDCSLFDDRNLWNLFRIRRVDVPRVLSVIRLRNVPMIECGKGNIFSGEELFLLARYRFVTGSTFAAMEIVFHREATEIAKGFRSFVTYMMRNFAYLLVDNLEFWKSYFPE